MAYGFGSTVNPQLGATNYSGYLQGALSGAQMQAQGGAAIGQGLASAGQGIGAGIAQGRERKEKMAERDRLLKEQQNAMTGRVQQVNNLGKALSKIEGLPSGFMDIFEDYKNVAGNPDVPLSQQNAYAESLLSQLPQVISLGLNETKRQKDIKNNEFLKQAIFLNTAADTGEVDFLSAGQTAVELGATPDYVTEQLKGFEGLTPKTPQPTEAVRNAQAAVDAAVAAGLPRDQAPALYAQMLGGPAAVTQAALQEKERDKQANEAKLSDEKKKQAERAELARFKLARAKDVIDKAISLSRLGAGGALQGLPGVRDVSAMVPGFVGIPGVVRGGGGSKTLASYVKTLQSLLSTENIKMLKELSASGATGFGNLSNVEGEKLATDVADLDPTLNEAIFRENAESIREYLTKLLGSTEEAEGRADTSPEPKPLSNKAQRFLEAVGSRFSPNSSR
jgi:hypothetical protein